MHWFSKTINRQRVNRVAIVLLIVIALSLSTIASAAADIQNDDFNGDSLNTSIWSETHTEGGAVISVSGGLLQMTVPAGESFTFSSTNIRAPRILQEITDDDFNVEVKFTSAMSTYQEFKMQGILVYDESRDTWLRFDFNTDTDSLNTYIGHLAPGNILSHIQNVSAIDSSFNTGPLYMRVQYIQSTGHWTLSYRLGDTGDFIVKYSFVEETAFGASGFSFSPSHIGLFAGSTGTQLPGHVMTADYFRSVGEIIPPPELNVITYAPIILN